MGIPNTKGYAELILIGDVIKQLATIDDESVQCVVTSPPYWGLRDYGVPGQMGLEPTLEEYIAKMVTVFQQVKRVLRKDGTLWLNMGDSYAGSRGNRGEGSTDPEWERGGHIDKKRRRPTDSGHGLKSKDMIGMPWRIAFALQQPILRCLHCEYVAHVIKWVLYPGGKHVCPVCGVRSIGYKIEERGWYLRSDIIWAKPNPMPESVTDRPTKAHEYIFLLTKSAKYYYDAEAIKTDIAESSIARVMQESFNSQHGGPKDPINGGEGSRNRSARQSLENLAERVRSRTPSGRNVNHDESDLIGRYPQKKQDALGLPTYEGFNGRYSPVTKVNRRTVWTIPTQPYPEAHFATFPEMIPKLCILAGTSSKGCCLECGAPWKRNVEVKYQNDTTTDGRPAKGNRHKEVVDREKTDEVMGYAERTRKIVSTLGWEPSCKCTAEIIPCTVLDPFCGSGTTLKVAQELGREWIGIELKPEYAELAAKRTKHRQELLPL